MRRIILGLVIVIGLMGWFSYRLLDVPTGLTYDEASFGYNGVLLAREGRDSNNRSWPLFVLSSNKLDWRQPVTQYYLAALFKIFGPSVFLLRFSSVLVTVAAIFLIYLLGRMLLGPMGALVAAGFLAMTPLMMIQAHFGLDNIMPVPLTIVWLWGLWRYREKGRVRDLVMASAALGIAFYSYKGMRAIVPVWLVVSGLWLLFSETRKRKLRSILIFGLSSLPFFLVVPLIQRLYPGAILGGARPAIDNVYQILLPYFSSFDISYLFILGDTVVHHSTGKHGMLLLSSLPLLVVGIYSAARDKNHFFKFLLAALFLGPLLYGTVGSVHRFSRLMALIPIYALLAGKGIQFLWEKKEKWVKLVMVGILLLMAVNYADFVSYYWWDYEGITYSLDGEMDYYKDLERQARVAEELGLEPVMHSQVAQEGGEAIKFFQVIYFGRLLPLVPYDDAAREGQLLLTMREKVPGMREVEGERERFYLLVAE